MSENVCIANINAAGRRRRLVLGVVVLAATPVAAWLLGGISPWWMFLAVPPFAFGMLCLIQALENT